MPLSFYLSPSNYCTFFWLLFVFVLIFTISSLFSRCVYFLSPSFFLPILSYRSICLLVFHCPSTLYQRWDQLRPHLATDPTCYTEVLLGCNTSRSLPAGSLVLALYPHINMFSCCHSHEGHIFTRSLSNVGICSGNNCLLVMNCFQIPIFNPNTIYQAHFKEC